MSENDRSPNPMFTNKTYNRLKFVAQIVLPALGTLYFALAIIWNLPAAQNVVGSITALDVFLGAILAYSTSKYVKSDVAYDGTFVIDTLDPEKDTYSVEFSTPLMALTDRKSVTLKVDAKV